MRVEQQIWDGRSSLNAELSSAQLVLVFGGTRMMAEEGWYAAVESVYPRASVLSATGAGQIAADQVHDEALVVTAVQFDACSVRHAEVELDASGSVEAGRRLASALPADGLRHVFVLSDGLSVNGSELIEGLIEVLPEGTPITGGLAGDDDRFAVTLVGGGRAPRQGIVAAAGLYGDRLRVSHGSLGGWDPFGPERVVTRSQGNVLYELDGKSALELYKRYLGDHAAALPSSALLFPLAIITDTQQTGVVRTVLGVDEAGQSMTFAGDMPEGARVRLMKANFDRLIDGANGAARATHEGLGDHAAELGILISCVGRRLVLKQRVEEELESVRDVLGEAAVLTGFYSYGEISPLVATPGCELHNQTMTITALTEVAA